MIPRGITIQATVKVCVCVENFQNFAVGTVALTGLLRKGVEFVCADACQQIFEKVKSVLSQESDIQ